MTLPASSDSERPMRAYEFRDGDIVEVSPGRSGGQPSPPFRGVVDTRLVPGRGADPLKWVYVRQLEPRIRKHSGGWYPHQCRLIIRPPARPARPVPANVVLSEA